MKKIGERVELIRGSLGVAAFADSIGVNRKTVQRWEDGLAIPDGNSLLLLKEQFGVDPSWLLTGEQPSPMRVEQERAPYGMAISDAKEMALVLTYREIDPEARATLQNMLKLIAGAGRVVEPAASPKRVARAASVVVHSSNLPDKKFTPPGEKRKKGGTV